MCAFLLFLVSARGVQKKTSLMGSNDDALGQSPGEKQTHHEHVFHLSTCFAHQHVWGLGTCACVFGGSVLCSQMCES